MHDTVPSTPWLHRLGASSGRHPARVLTVWLIALLAVFCASRFFKATYSDNVSLTGTQASTVAALLVAHDPALAGSTGLVVLHSRTGRLAEDRRAVDEVIANLARLAHVVHVTNPLAANSTTLSPSGTVGYAVLNFNVTPKSLGPTYPGALYRASEPATRAGLQVEFGGGLDQVVRPKITDLRSELIGLVVAFVVLALTFDSVLAGVLPLLSALISVLIGLSVLGLVALAITFGTASPTLAAMIGLGVGIDYAVFLTTRFRQLMMDGADPVDAAGFVTASSGRAVLVAASTVAVAMLGLYGSGMTFIGQLGLGAAFSILTAALGAVTLVPAGLAAEPGREALGRRLRGSPVHEHEFEAPVSARAGQILEYQLDGARLGGRGGHDAHAERKAGDVDADDSFCPVSPAIGTALVVESHATIGGPSREMCVDDHHRWRGFFSTKCRARRGVESGEHPSPRVIPRPSSKLRPDPGPGAELFGQISPLTASV